MGRTGLVDVSAQLDGITNSLRDYAFIGDVALHAHLGQLCDHDPLVLDLFTRPVRSVQAISREKGIGIVSPEMLGPFALQYDAMLNERVTGRVMDRDVYVVPLEYSLAMLLDQDDHHSGFYLGGLIKLGRDRINSEAVRATLKSVGLPQRFDRYVLARYDF